MHSRIIKIHLRSWVVILGCASLSELQVRSAGTEQMVLVILPSWLTAQWATLSSWYPWAALPCLDVGFNNTNKPACFFNVPSEAAFQNLISVCLSVCTLAVAFWALLSSTILESNALSQLWWPDRHRVPGLPPTLSENSLHRRIRDISMFYSKYYIKPYSGFSLLLLLRPWLDTHLMSIQVCFKKSKLALDWFIALYLFSFYSVHLYRYTYLFMYCCVVHLKRK